MALLDIDTLPLALPAVVGLKVTFSVAVWLGTSTVPEFTPVALNPVPLGVTLAIVTFEFPLLVNVTPRLLLLPSCTLPKLKLVGLTPNNCVEPSPAPVNEIASGELGPLFDEGDGSVNASPDVGENATLKVVLPPAPIAAGTARPLMLNPVPDAFAWEIVTLAVPLFFSLMVCVLVLPMPTLPKFTLAGVGAS